MTRFVVRVLARSPLQTAIRILVLAASAALLGAMVLFVGHSLRTMTGSAVRSVPLDWQGPVASATAAKHVARDVGLQESTADELEHRRLRQQPRSEVGLDGERLQAAD